MSEAIRARVVCNCSVGELMANERLRIEQTTLNRGLNSDNSVKSIGQTGQEDKQVAEEIINKNQKHK